MEIEVAVPTPLFQTFTYNCEEQVPVGSRVLVPFGARNVIGVALGASAKEPVNNKASKRAFAVKNVHSLIDKSPIYSEVMLRIAQWMSRYYAYPLGEVLKAMLPASAVKTTTRTYSLTDKALKQMQEQIKQPVAEFLSGIFKRRTKIGAHTLRTKLKTQTTFTLEDLLAQRLLRLTQSSEVAAREVLEEELLAPPIDLEKPRSLALKLTSEQESAFAFLKEKISSTCERKPVLLRGVTGSGKTEIYLQLIAENLALGKQTLVLVPEISLTPQMTKIFSDRFTGQVAVVHSNLSHGERWHELNRIRFGHAHILIGPRSAIFGPFKDLGLIIVDEEHDSSYKQTTGLTYNARDIAILRGQWEKALVLLGSATPAMESMQNVRLGRYDFLELKNRVLGRAMPAVELVVTEPAYRKGTKVESRRNLIDLEAVQIPIADQVVDALKKNFQEKKQSIVLVHRRGYAYYLFSQTQKKAISCPQCSISLTLHRRSQWLCCHYCDYRVSTEKILKSYPDDDFLAVGYGSEKMETFLSAAIPQARVARVDSETSRKSTSLHDTFAQFRRGELDILVGTQILAKGHDFPNVTLVVIVDVDQILDLPDFRAGERTFQLLVQAAGRAGRDVHPGRVLIQTSRPSHPVIRYALAQDFMSFANWEMQFRKDYNYPPHCRMTLVEISSTDKGELQTFCAQVERWLQGMASMDASLKKTVKVQGPSLAPIETIRNRHRRFVLLSGSKPEVTRTLVDKFLHAFAKPPGDVRIKIDVDPMNLL